MTGLTMALLGSVAESVRLVMTDFLLSGTKNLNIVLFCFVLFCFVSVRLVMSDFLLFGTIEIR
jgi:hypothetical protein